MKSELIIELKNQIVQILNLNDISPEDIGDDQPLFVDGLGLDSIDALELIVLLQQQYKVKLSDQSQGPKVFYSVSTIADYIIENKQNNNDK